MTTHTIWRWLRNGQLEITPPGQRVDWVTPGHVYITLGWVTP